MAHKPATDFASRLLSVPIAMLAGVGGVVLILVIIFLSGKFAASAPTPTVAKSIGPTVQQLEQLGEIATTCVHITDVMTAEGEGYKGCWLIKGDAVLSCNMQKATIVSRDDEKQVAVIELPQLQVMSPRVDHEKTKTWNVKNATWLPWKRGNQDVFRDAAMLHAQRIIEHAAKDDENKRHAKAHAELMIRKMYDLVGWQVSIKWRDQPYNKTPNRSGE